MREKILEVRGLSKHFPMSHNRILKAAEAIDLDIYKGKTFGLVGESGCRRGSPDLPLHRPRPVHGEVHQRPRGRHVPRQARRGGGQERALQQSPASLHPGAPLLHTRPRPEDRAGAKGDPHRKEISSPLERLEGCSFRTRCPFAVARCAKMEYTLKDTGNQHYAMCTRFQ